MYRKIILSISVVIVLSSIGFSEGGKTGWWILRRPQSTKPKPLTAVAGIRGDLSGVLYNSSVLSTIEQREVFLMTELGLANDSFGGILYGQPLRIGNIISGGFSVGFIYYDAGKEKLYYVENNQEREQEVPLQRDVLVLASYGQRVTGSIFAGATVKYANSSIVQAVSASAYAADLGMIYLPPVERLVVSLGLQNLGLTTKFVDKAEKMPTSLWCGVSYLKGITGSSYLCVGLELPYIIGEGKVMPSVGIEYSIGQFAVNLGYRFGAQDPLFHAGVGFSTARFDFGYAFLPARYLSHTHRLSVGFRF